jgi:DNA-binding response OmpR family regulator
VGLLVTDLAMPRMTGAELAVQARGLRPGLPVLVLTGHADAAPLDPGQPVLHKPFRLGELARSVTALLR